MVLWCQPKAVNSTLRSAFDFDPFDHSRHTRGVVDASAPYELRTSFPTRVLGQTSETLHAAKLTPSATLFVRTRGLLT